MDGKYVIEELKLPQIDKELVYFTARSLLPGGEDFPKELIEYAINNFLKAKEAYEDDFDPDKLYYTFENRQMRYNICFNADRLAHLLGINVRSLNNVDIIKKLLKQKFQNVRGNKNINDSNWIQVLAMLFIDNKTEIIENDSQPQDDDKEKLNWDKIAIKLFCFLNLGILSDYDKDNPWLCYQKKRKNNADQEVTYIMARNVYSNGIEGQIRLTLTLTPVEFSDEKGNIREEKMLVPVSIIYEEKPKRQNQDFSYVGLAIITQNKGGQYGKKTKSTQ